MKKADIFPLNPMNVFKMFLWQRQSACAFLTMSTKLVFLLVGGRFRYFNLNQIIKTEKKEKRNSSSFDGISGQWKAYTESEKWQISIDERLFAFET